jgi:hypothetical protein
MNKNEFEQKIEELDENKGVSNSIITEQTAEEENLPDFAKYLESEEYIREGDESRTPMKINHNGKDYKIYVRPLTSQEYYSIQMDAINKKESLDLLACELAAVDSSGNRLNPSLLGRLKAGTIQNISAGIRLISGIDTQDMDYKEIMEYFLKT